MKTFQSVVLGSLLLLAVVPASLAAGEKAYPERGTVTTLATNQETTGTGSSVFTHLHRTYTVKTSNRVFVLQCPNFMDNLLGARECGGKKKIAVGDTLLFRVNKSHAYVQTDKGKEQRLEIISEGLRGESAETTKQ